MTEASYPRLALLLQLICFPAIYMAPSHAPVAELQNQNAISIGQNVQNLVDTLSADPDIRYRNSTMAMCIISVDEGDHDPDHFHDYPLSSSIGDFRDIACMFRYGGPIADERRSFFSVRNQWPLYWDQWWPPGDTLYYPWEAPPFSWRKAVGYMSAERANRLLKARGHQGAYACVSLGKTTAHPDGVWCFRNVQIPDAEGGGQRHYSVDVRTGRVEETRSCQGFVPGSISDKPPSIGYHTFNQRSE